MNKERGEETISIDGQEYTARPSHNAMAEIEASLGVGILRTANRFYTMNASSTDIANVIYFSIKEVESPRRPSDMPWTLNELRELIYKKGVVNYLDPATKLITAMVTGETEEEQNQKNEPSTDTASPST